MGVGSRLKNLDDRVLGKPTKRAARRLAVVLLAVGGSLYVAGAALDAFGG